jgi:hypothetical protein
MIRQDSKKDKLDQTALQFLGAKRGEVQVHEGQKASADKQRKQHEQMLIKEACDFGNTLVRYIVNHKDMPLKARVWSFALGVLCVRDEYPEGGEKFDELADLGGEDLQLTPPTKQHEEAMRSHARNLPVLEGEVLLEAARFAELVAKYVTTKKHQSGLNNLQAAYGLGRAFHNLRQTFPAEEGGVFAFDEYARQAGVYFDNR